jgi:hypothetical protein
MKSANGSGESWLEHKVADTIVTEIGGQSCGLFAVDIAGFTAPQRDEQVQHHIREAMYRMLQRAFDGSALPWADCQHEDRGDGVLIVVSPALPVGRLADPLPERLRGLIRVHNRLSSQAAQIQLRAAAHIGVVHKDQHGFIGDAVNHLFRLLNDQGLKELLEASAAELAFIASDYLYESVILRHPTLVDPGEFQPIEMRRPHSNARGWVHLPGTAAGSASILPLNRSALSRQPLRMATP